MIGLKRSRVRIVVSFFEKPCRQKTAIAFVRVVMNSYESEQVVPLGCAVTVSYSFNLTAALQESCRNTRIVARSWGTSMYLSVIPSKLCIVVHPVLVSIIIIHVINVHVYMSFCTDSVTQTWQLGKR